MIKTFGETIRETRKALSAAGIAAAELESRLICEYASGLSRTELIKQNRQYTNSEFENKVLSALARRLGGEPVAYITGEWEFCGLPIIVSRETLIPRSDTETLALAAVDELENRGASRVLDICAGSGCVGLAIAKKVLSAKVALADNSPGALSVAEQNIRALKLTRRVSAINADALKSPPAIGLFDMIVSNPPYIPSAEIESLDDSVKDYEPRQALDGGEDGLNFYRKIAGLWKIVLKDGGSLFFETGYSQAEAVQDILSDNGYQNISCTFDLSGITRVVSGINTKHNS